METYWHGDKTGRNMDTENVSGKVCWKWKIHEGAKVIPTKMAGNVILLGRKFNL